MSAPVPWDRNRQFRIIRANSLAYERGGLLADFEAELIADVHRRMRDRDPAARLVTVEEWAVIDQAVEALEAAPRVDPAFGEWAA